MSDDIDLAAPWYLLYGGSSEDGNGPGKYLGRTLDPAVALEHLKKVEADHYSTGYVVVATDEALVQGRSRDSLSRQGFLLGPRALLAVTKALQETEP